MALPTDELISRDGLMSIRKHVPIVIGGLKVIVQGGHVTLQGRVHLAFLSSRAEKVVRQLPGVTGLTNQIVVTPLPGQRGSAPAHSSAANTSSMDSARAQTRSATASVSFKSTTGTPASGNS